jgi:hypothetical protein
MNWYWEGSIGAGKSMGSMAGENGSDGVFLISSSELFSRENFM